MFILYDFNIYEAKKQVKLIYGDRHWNNGYLWVRKNNEKVHEGGFTGIRKAVHLLQNDGYTGIWIYKHSLIIHLRFIHFIVCVINF